MEIYKTTLITILSSLKFQGLIWFIAFDIVTGTLSAFREGIVYSKYNKAGITNHFILIMFVIFCCSGMVIFHVEEYVKLIIYFYIASYALSIFENLTRLGVPFPVWLKEKFTLLKEETNEGVTNEVERIDK